MKVAVIGLGRFGLALARELRQIRQVHLVAIDSDPKVVQQLNQEGEWVTRFEGFGAEAFALMGIDRTLDVAVIAIGEAAEDVQRWILGLLELEVDAVLARAQTDAMSAVMERLLGSRGPSDAHRVIRPEREAALQLAPRLLLPGMAEVQGLSDSTHAVATVAPPEWLVGKSIVEARLRDRYGINVLRIQRRDPEKPEAPPRELIPVSADTVIEAHDSVTVLGRRERILEMLEGA